MSTWTSPRATGCRAASGNRKHGRPYRLLLLTQGVTTAGPWLLLPAAAARFPSFAAIGLWALVAVKLSASLPRLERWCTGAARSRWARAGSCAAGTAGWLLAATVHHRAAQIAALALLTAGAVVWAPAARAAVATERQEAALDHTTTLVTALAPVAGLLVARGPLLPVALTLAVLHLLLCAAGQSAWLRPAAGGVPSWFARRLRPRLWRITAQAPGLAAACAAAAVPAGVGGPAWTTLQLAGLSACLAVAALSLAAAAQ